MARFSYTDSALTLCTAAIIERHKDITFTFYRRFFSTWMLSGISLQNACRLKWQICEALVYCLHLSRNNRQGLCFASNYVKEVFVVVKMCKFMKISSDGSGGISALLWCFPIRTSKCQHYRQDNFNVINFSDRCLLAIPMHCKNNSNSDFHSYF